MNVAAARPPDFLLAALRDALGEVAAYPDEAPVRTHLAGHLAVDEDRLLLVNGVAEAFVLMARAHAWRCPVVVHPQFTEPEAALRSAGHTVVQLVLTERDDFRFDPAAVPACADLVVLGNPTNPTSRLHPARDVLQLLRPGRLVVVDEAFMDVVPGERESVLAAAAGGRGLVVFRSLTKTFSLAGVRAGYVIGDPAWVARLRAGQPHWSVNALALAAIARIASPAGDAHTAALAREMAARRPILEGGLRDRGFVVTPESAGPFLLARHPHAAEVRAALREGGVAVRRGDTFPGLGPQWLRFALRDAAACAAVFAALDALPASLACGCG